MSARTLRITLLALTVLGIGVASYLWNRVAKEAAQTLTQRVIPQGAAELSQALFSQSNAYVPYGQGQRPVAPAQGPQQSYQEMLRAASQRGGPAHGRGMGMDR